MSVPATSVPAVPSTRTPAPAGKAGMEDHTWLLFLGVQFAVVLVFVAMIVITVLAGGDGFPS